MIVFIDDAAAAGGDTARFSVTVPTTSVASTLTDYPVYVDLGDAPGGFWSEIAFADGRDIRVKDGSGTDVPFDLVKLDRASQTGVLFFKATLTTTSATVVYIHCGDTSLSAVAPGAANGRNAVWSGFDRVVMLGTEFEDRTGSGAVHTNVTANTMVNSSTSADLGVHQGVCWDGTHYYVTDTNAIKKYDASFNLVASNNNPCASVPGTNHCGDPDVVGVVLYVPIENYVSSTSFSAQHIARFNASDLSFIDAVDVSAQGHECAGICWNHDDGKFYVVAYTGTSTTTIYKYNSDLTYNGTFTLGSGISEIQGITYWRGAFYVNSDTQNATLKVQTDGTVLGRVWGISSGAYEGVGHTDDELLVLHDTSGSGNGVVRTLKVSSIDVATLGSTSAALGYCKMPAPRRTSWTIGASASIASKGANRAIVSYGQDGVGTDSIRASLLFRNTSDRFGLWNSTDAFLLDTASPTVNQHYRLNVTHDGTTERKIYRDGSNTATDATIAERPTSVANVLWIGTEDSDLAERMNGSIGYVYLRNGILSANWIAAEALNVLTPGSFYTVGSLETI